MYAVSLGWLPRGSHFAKSDEDPGGRSGGDMAAAAKTAASVKKLIPLLDRVLVEKVVPPTKSAGGVLLPETKSSGLNTGKVIAVGSGGRTKDGKTIPVAVKEGDTVVLPEYGGTSIKLEDKDYVLYRDEEILGLLEE